MRAHGANPTGRSRALVCTQTMGRNGEVLEEAGCQTHPPEHTPLPTGEETPTSPTNRATNELLVGFIPGIRLYYQVQDGSLIDQFLILIF